ncbi:anaphase-promoting complex subunit 4 [Zerene cesonia]|uniref:anaphase-promoting complex subunit 4 n=1 Tax=Zerene cesonia TaxID=33412 RepID=UPI0018E58E25|nr:anaphase-promoting complex subunit 4 [Zerene cesonia]
MYHCGMRQMEERHVANQVDLMVWSHRLDLLALTNSKGEVQVHRLHWQKVWSLPPPSEDVVVDSMAWRPDGKALAIGYNNGSVYIVDIEDKTVIDKYDFVQEVVEESEYKNYGIPCIRWAVKAGTLESATEYNLYDDCSIFLQMPPSPSTAYKAPNPDEKEKGCVEHLDQFNQLNLLMIAYGTGNIFMSVFGRYPYRSVHMSQFTKDEYGDYEILDIQMSDDFSVMQVLYVERNTNRVIVSVTNTSVLSAYSEELSIVANKHVHIVQMISHLDKTMKSITEAWEHILLEMDTKMAYYASTVPEGGVSADLLELLMLGVPSDELEVFLLRELTAKGLKKFGSSVELSYSTIQKLVLKQLNIVGQNLIYHLSELRGLAKIPDRYKVLGLDETKVTSAIRASFAFLNKCLELQQVIDVSMRNYKAFFRWLFVAIVRLLDEHTPSEIVKITQQELTHIADFLYNFDNVQVENDEDTEEKPMKFNLERLGQYLQDQELTILPDDEDNPWYKILKENSCLLKENDTIYSTTEFKKFSLVQQQKYLNREVEEVFDIHHKDIAKNFSVLYNIKCYDGDDDLDVSESVRISQIFDPKQQRFMMAIVNTTIPQQGLYFMSVSVKERLCSATTCEYFFSPSLIKDCNPPSSVENLEILDIQFYSSEYLSLLLKHPTMEDSTIFLQLPLKIALENSQEFNMKCRNIIFNEDMEKIDLSPLLDQSVYKVLEKMNGNKIAVSGARKVAVVLSNIQRKVRVFEMEINGEDEDDDTFDTTPQLNLTHNSETIATPDKDRNTGNITF